MNIRLSIAALLALTLLACGEPTGEPVPATTVPAPADPEGTEPPPAETAIAPRCEELLPETPRVRYDEGAPIPTPSPTVDHSEVHDWATSTGREDFAGIWMDPPGSGRLTVAFTDGVEEHRRDAGERFGDLVTVVEARWTMDELRALQADIDAAAREGHASVNDWNRPPPGTIISSGIFTQLGLVSVGVVGGDDDELVRLSEQFGTDRICLEIHEPPEPMDPDGPVRPLVKVDGWDEATLPGDPFALLQIAYDRETAERAWQEQVPDGLPGRDGDPVEEGLYGTLDDVDFAEQAVVVWHAGQSGSCPGWLANVEVRPDGSVDVEHGAAGTGICTSDYNPYRMLLAVDLDRLPAAGDLPLVPPEDEPVSTHVRRYE